MLARFALTNEAAELVPVEAAVAVRVEGEEVFAAARSLLFRSVNVRRLYDVDSGTIVYVSYSKRLNKGDDENKSRFKTTMCAVKVEPPAKLRPKVVEPPPVPAPEPAPAPSRRRFGARLSTPESTS